MHLQIFDNWISVSEMEKLSNFFQRDEGKKYFALW